MIYEVRARLLFKEEDEARDFYHDCEMAYPKSTTIHLDDANEEISFAELLENHHEDEPNQPCKILAGVV